MTWTINGTQANGLRGAQPAPTPGESGDFPFGFLPTQGTTDHVSRFKTLRNYARSAGQFHTYESIQGDIYWREQQSNGPSPLAEIQPPANNTIAHPFWGLVESVSDETIVDNNCTLTLSLVYIAPYGTETSEFSTESDLRTAREVTGP